LYYAIDIALEFSRKIQEHDSDSSALLFDKDELREDFVVEPKLPNVPEWGFRERLAREKEFLNFYFSGHPLDKHRHIIGALSNVNLSDPGAIKNGENVRVVGALSEVETRIDKKKQKYAFASIEDFNGKAELVIWSDTYSRFYHLLDEDRIVLVVGKAEAREEGNLKIFVNEIYSIDEALSRFIDSIHIYLYENIDTVEKLLNFAKLCNSIDSSVKVLFIIKNNGTRKAYVADNVQFNLNEENIIKLYEIFGNEFVRLIPKSG
jgi:DNA polymerase-3 subunit alpha